MDIPLSKIARVGAVDRGAGFATGIANSAGAAFERGDLVAFLTASGEWEKADGDWDVNAANPLFALALNNPRVDAFTVPLYNASGATFGQRFGPDRDQFDYARLDGLEVEINVDDTTAFTAAHRGGTYGLLYDATTGIMTVDLSDTTNAVFFVKNIAPARPIAGLGYGNVIGDTSVRVRGHFVSSVCY